MEVILISEPMVILEAAHLAFTWKLSFSPIKPKMPDLKPGMYIPITSALNVFVLFRFHF